MQRKFYKRLAKWQNFTKHFLVSYRKITFCSKCRPCKMCWQIFLLVSKEALVKCKIWERIDIYFWLVIVSQKLQIGWTISWRLKVSRNCPKAWPPQKVVTDSQTTKNANSRCFIPSPTHELINYIDTMAKCRHLKNWLAKVLCVSCLSQSCWYFRPSFVNYCPSNLLYGSTPPPLPCVNKCAVYTYTVCNGGEYGVLGLYNTFGKVPLQVKF
jgi:hypothetical protein